MNLWEQLTKHCNCTFVTQHMVFVLQHSYWAVTSALWTAYYKKSQNDKNLCISNSINQGENNSNKLGFARDFFKNLVNNIVKAIGNLLLAPKVSLHGALVNHTGENNS